MKFIAVFVLGIIASVNIHAQDTAAVRKAAESWVKGFYTNDPDSVLKYIHPKLIASVGSREKISENIKKGFDDMNAEGTTFRNVHIGQIGKMYKAGLEIHCIIPQELSMNIKEGFITTKSEILVITADNWETWKFFVTDGDENYLKQVFPDFNKDMIIKKASRPVFHEK